MKRSTIILVPVVVMAWLWVSPPVLSAARLEGGIKLGMNIAFIHGPDVVYYPGLDYDWFIRLGWCGGGFLALPFSRELGVQAEALITVKGSHEARPLFAEDYETYILRLTYLEIPVLARLATPPTEGGFQVVFMAGPALGFKLGGQLIRGGQVIDHVEIRPIDLGLVVSIGAAIRSRGFWELRYTAGMSKIIEVGGVPMDIKNGVVSIIAGFGF